MKIYEYQAFPHPRKARIFLAEKGIGIEYVQVDVPTGEHRLPEVLSKNPDGVVPFLELDNEEYISESVAICRYFEEVHPEKPLMGTSPQEKAKIEMWLRKVDSSIMNTVATCFHHATDGLGEKDRYRNEEWGEKIAKMQ